MILTMISFMLNAVESVKGVAWSLRQSRWNLLYGKQYLTKGASDE